MLLFDFAVTIAEIVQNLCKNAQVSYFVHFTQFYTFNYL